ncbi:MAG: alpha/beta hydrolase [Actinomycetota bacterium]|nr:alpha/beta hydrolase [Actinomycetota bacterium]
MKLLLGGLTAHAATGGNEFAATGPVILMIHGAGMDATAWHLQTRYLANRGVRALAVDLPGHGLSDGQPLTSVDAMADWVAEFIEGAHLTSEGPITVAGHSMGTFIALSLAARRPDLVTDLVLLAPADAMGVHPDLLDAAANDLPQAAFMMCDWGHGAAGHLGPNPNPGMWMTGGARALIERGRPGALSADFEACVAFDRVPELVAAVTCPVHLVIGSVDKMTPPRAADSLAKAFTLTPTVTRLDGVGHMMMTEAAADIRRILLAHRKTPA